MSKLDEIEDEWKNHDPGFIISDNIDYLLTVARKAEEMAKLYAGKVEHYNRTAGTYTHLTLVDDKGETAREFLSFLEKGE